MKQLHHHRGSLHWGARLVIGLVVAAWAHPPVSATAQWSEELANNLVPPADFTDEIDFFKVESDVVTSVSRHPESLWGSAGAVYVITGESIREAGFESLADALRMVPGLDVAAVDRNTYAVSARGLNNTFADKMLVLLDGRPIYTPLFGGTLWHQWGTFLPDIDRIEVIRGPGGTLWGANAMNGVINIITKTSEDTHGLLVRTLGGSNDRGQVELRYGSRSGHFNYRLSGRYNADEGFGGDGGDKVADDNQEARAGYRFDWDLGRGLVLRGSTEFADIRIGNEGREVGTGRILFPGPKYETDLVTGVWRLEKDFANGSNGYVQAAADYISRKTPFLGVTPGRGSFATIRRTWEVDFQYGFRVLERHRITWGGQVRQTNVDVGTGILAINVDSSRDTLNVFGVFLQDEVTLPFESRLTIGTKIENNTFTGTNFQPSARLTHRLDNGSVVWGSISQAVNTPSYGDNYVSIPFPPDTTSEPGTVILPVFRADGTADNTTLLAYEVGFRHRFHESLSLDLAAFYNDYNGIVSFSGKNRNEVPLGPGVKRVETLLDNESDAFGYGIEGALDFIAGDRLSGQLNATWQRLGMAGFRNPSAPAWKVNFRTVAQISDTLSVVPSVYYVDTVRLPSIFGAAVPSESIDDYIRVDIAAHYQPKESWPTISLIGQNLTERSHVEFSEPLVRLPSPVTRSWMLRVEYKL